MTKRDDPEYHTTTIYLKRSTHKRAKVTMLLNDDQRNFSMLVEDLLKQWLKGMKAVSK